MTAVCGCAAKLRYHWWLWRLWSSRFGQRSRRVLDMQDCERQRVLEIERRWLGRGERERERERESIVY